jgi:hypothetical protein
MANKYETERYRKAAYLTLDQLDWCVEYFRSISKPRISRQIAKNRSAIAQRLVREGHDRDSRT